MEGKLNQIFRPNHSQLNTHNCTAAGAAAHAHTHPPGNLRILINSHRISPCMTKPSSPKKPTAAVAAVDCSAAADRYKGVRRRKWGKYVSEIRLPNSRERIWLGSYDSAEKAARAFDAALFCLRGSSARFNFPNNPPPAIAGAGLLSRAEIQTVAAQFANSDPPPSSECTRPAANSPMNSSSPSPSVVSEVGTAVVECDERSPFLDLHTDNYGSGFGYFEPEYNPFFDEFSSSSATPYFDYGEENFDAMTTHQDSFLWNF